MQNWDSERAAVGLQIGQDIRVIIGIDNRNCPWRGSTRSIGQGIRIVELRRTQGSSVDNTSGIILMGPYACGREYFIGLPFPSTTILALQRIILS